MDNSKKPCFCIPAQSVSSCRPKLDRVHKVLPEDVASWTHGGDRIEVGVGNPDGKGGVLLPQCLSGIDGAAITIADELAYGKLQQAKQQRAYGYPSQQCRSGIAMDYVLHRGASDYCQRHAPQVEAKVGYRGDALLQARQEATHYPSQQQRQYEHEAHLIHYDEEGSPECEVGFLLYQREECGYECRRDEAGEERIGGHGVEVAAYLHGYDSCCCRRRPYYAGQYAFPQYFL